MKNHTSPTTRITVPPKQDTHDAVEFSDFAPSALGVFTCIVFLKMTFLQARLTRQPPPRSRVLLWTVLSAIWVIALIITFLKQTSKSDVTTGTFTAVGLTVVALVMLRIFRRQGTNQRQADTTLGDARRASRAELSSAGYVMQYDPETQAYYGKKGIPLGSYEDIDPMPAKKILGFTRFDPQHIEPVWNGLFHPNTIYYHSPAHLITIAPARSGKARDTLVPALLSNGLGSAVVIDPKGQLAAVTARARSTDRRQVFCLNPFGLHAERLPPAVGFNPMASLDVKSPAFGVDCDSIAAALIWDTGNDTHWTDSAAQLISGLVMYFAKFDDPEMQNLVAVRSVIASAPDVFRSAIDTALATGDLLIIERLSRFADLSDDDREAKSIISTARTQTAFISNDAIRESLKAHGVNVADLRHGPNATVYLILPGEYIDTCKKWFRLVIDSLLRGLMKNQQGNEVVMVLDEFANLGHLGSVETAMALAAGYGVKLWPILQDLNQLKELYKNKWETFLANSGMQQFFTPRDQTTADYISKRCGQMTVKVMNTSTREVSSQEAREGLTGISHSQSTQARELFLPQDIMAMSGDRQLLFMAGVPQVVVGYRYPYWDWPNFQGKYDEDPYHT